MPVKAVNWHYEKPRWVDYEKIDKDGDVKQAVVIQKGTGSAEVIAWESAERVVAIKATQPITVRIRTFYFPGWKAYVDGIRKEIKTEEDVGAMLIEIPKGKHELVLRFEDTPVRYYSKIISLITFCVLVFISLFSRKKTGSF